MPKYKVNIDGNFVTKEVSKELFPFFIKKYPNAELISETPPTENFQNGDAETDASVTPETNQASNGDSTSEDGSLEEQEQPVKIEFEGDLERKPKKIEYIKFKGGQEVRSDLYKRDFAGKESSNGQLYPETFEEYAKLYNAPIQTKYEQPKLPSSEAISLNKTLDSVNSKTPKAKNEIAKDYFNLTEGAFGADEFTPLMPEYAAVKNKDGKLVPIGESTTGREYTIDKSGFTNKRVYTNSYEEDLKNYLGEEKYNTWVEVQEKAKLANETLTPENIHKYIDLSKIEQNTITDVVTRQKKEAASNYMINNDIPESEQFKIAAELEGDNEALEIVQKNRREDAARKKDNADFEAKFGRPLTSKETIQGRTYIPYNEEASEERLNNQLKEYQANSEADIQNRYKKLDQDLNDYTERGAAPLEEIQADYDYLLGNIEKNFNNTDDPEYRQLLQDQYAKTFREGNAAMSAKWNELDQQRQAMMAESDRITKRAGQLSKFKIAQEAAYKTYELDDRMAMVMENSFLGSGAMLGASAKKFLLGDVPIAIARAYSSNDINADLAEQRILESQWYGDLVADKGAAIDYNQRLQSRNEEKLFRPTLDNEGLSTSDYLGMTLVDNSPSILVAATTMGAGTGGAAAVKLATNVATGVFFTMETGGQMANLEIAQREAAKIKEETTQALLETDDPTEISELKKILAEQEDILNMSQWQKSMSSLIYGGTAALAERFGSLGFINNFQKYSRAIGYNQFRKVMNRGMSRVLSKNIGALGGIGIGAGIETLEEGLTLVGQNLSDITILGEDKSLFEGLDKDFVANTLITSIAISGPMASQNIYSAVASEFRNSREAKKEAKLRSEILEIQNELNSDQLTADARNILRKRRRAALKELALENTNIVLKVNDLTAEQFEAITEANREIRILEKEAAALGASGDVSNWSTREMDRLNEELTKIKGERESVFQKKDQEMEKLLKDIDGPGNKVEAAANVQLYFYSKNIIKGQDNVNSTEINSAEQLEEYLNQKVEDDQGNEKDKFNEVEKNVLRKGYKDGNNAANPSVQGKNSNEIVLFKENIIAGALTQDRYNGRIAAMSPLHELGHIQTRNAGIIKNDRVVGDGKKMVEGIIAEVTALREAGTISKEVFDIFNKRVLAYKKKEYADTNGIDADELIQLVADLTNIGALPKSSYNKVYEIKTGINSIMRFLNGDASMYFKLDDASSIFQFVSSWTKKAVKGKSLNIDTDEEEGTTKLSRKLTEAEEDRMEAIDQEIGEIGDDLMQGFIDQDTHDRKIAKLEEEYENIENPPKVEAKPKPKAKRKAKSDIDAPQASKKDEQKLSDVTAKSKKKLDAVGNNPEGFDANDPVIYETLDGMIRSKVKAFKTAGNNIVNLTNLPGFEMDNMVSETIASLIPYIKKFDPAKNDSLFGYTMAQLSNRMRGALKTGRVTENTFTEDVTAAKNITAEESSNEVKEKPKYRNLTDAGGVSGEVIDAIKAKLKTVLRTLKSRMDAAISNNRTVTPLMAEIQFEMGKQADIDLKTAMGGKKDGKLRKFLLKNKKAVLQNMTTTWLMGKDGQGGIPQAIQKKLKETGEYVSYPAWVGKEIAREKTSTDDAGRTSGALLVRRHPSIVNYKNVDGVIDDDTYLAQFLNETGNPIRGRKEALAKAMAEEISFEIFTSEIVNPASEISEAFEANQERLGTVIADNLVEQIQRDADRGNIKFSIATKNSAFEKARKDLTTYLKAEFKNELAQGLFYDPNELKKLRAGDPDLNTLWQNLVDLHVMEAFNNKSVTKKSIEQFAKFNAAGNTDLTTYLNAVVDKAAGDITNIFNENAKDISFANLSENAKTEVDLGLKNLLLSLIGSKGNVEGVNAFIRMVQPGLTTGTDQSIYGTNAGFMSFIKGLQEGDADIDAAIKESGLELRKISKKADTFFSKESKNSKDKIKTTSVLVQEANATDFKGLIDGTGYNVKFAERLELSEKSAIQFMDMVEQLKKLLNDKSITPLATAIIMNSQGKTMRTAAKTLAKLRSFYKGDGKTAKDYTFEHGTPTKQLLIAASNYIMGRGVSKAAVQSIIDKSQITILPKSIAKSIDAVSQSTFPVAGALKEENPGDTRMFTDRMTILHPGFTKNNILDLREVSKLSKDKADIAVKNYTKFSKNLSGPAYTKAINGQKAINNATSIKFSQNPKGISVFDFDDTLARTKSNVLYVMPDGKKGKLNAAQFAARSETMLEQGAEFDFSEFSKVMKGELGPLFSEAQKKEGKYTNKDIFVLTARPANSAAAIHEFLKSEGLNIPIENITGLGDGSPQAKADWMVGKIAEGYNDFYFADDHMGNVKAVGKALKSKGVKGQTELSIVDFKNQPKAVRDILNTFDVKGPTQRSRVKFSKQLNKNFNDMLERASGIKSRKRLTRVEGEILGKNKGRWKIWMPSSLEDFRGLTEYTFAGKGRQGDADQKFFQDALVKPYWRAINEIDIVKQSLKNGFAALNKQYKPVLKKLGKRVPGMAYTHDQALRVYLWNKAGYEIPGLTRKQERELVRFVQGDAELMAYANGALQVAQKKEWSKPSEYWAVQTILSDINNFTEKTGRKEYLKEFIENSDLIFSENNLNKIEAIYGKAHREAIEDILYRMKNGVNRAASMKKNEQKWNNWLNNSIGAIMFFNRRSALLQLLSTVNFINWSDNNPMKAAAAFANQKQYWADFAMIFNSPKLKQRRSGLKTDVNAAELASAVTGATDKATAALNYLLKIGFTPTQMVDSFAIAAGGATFYRNRVNTYLKEKGADGKPKYTRKQAEDKAFKDFIPISDETQQSGDPALISSDQASSLGRVVLNFMNTPIQLNRSIKKSAQDIYNRRRIPGQTQAQSDFTNFSKIIYYGTIQNAIFSALQAAMFALIPGFNDEEDEEGKMTMEEKTEKKIFAVVNSMVDTTLKGGFGLPGAVVSILKNAIIEYKKQTDKGFLADDSKTLIALLNISPAVGSKARKIVNFAKGERFDKEVISERGWDVTIDGRFNLSPRWNSAGNLVEGITNIPMARVVDEVNSITEALDSRNTAWQRIALALGWKTWNVGAKNEENDLLEIKIKSENKERKAEERKEKRKKEKLLKEMKEKDRRSKLTQDERDIEDFIKKEKRRIKSRNTRAKNKKKKDSIAEVDAAALRARIAKKRKEKEQANKNK